VLVSFDASTSQLKEVNMLAWESVDCEVDSGGVSNSILKGLPVIGTESCGCKEISGCSGGGDNENGLKGESGVGLVVLF